MRIFFLNKPIALFKSIMFICFTLTANFSKSGATNSNSFGCLKNSWQALADISIVDSWRGGGGRGLGGVDFFF